MLADFDKACGKIGLRLNLKKTMFTKNGLVSFAPFTLNGTNISECSSYVYLGREINMMNDLAPELSRRKRGAWRAFKSIEDAVKRTKNTRLRAHLFVSMVLSALTYASETWSLRKQDERSLSVIERAVERTVLGVSRYTRTINGHELVTAELLLLDVSMSDRAEYQCVVRNRFAAEHSIRSTLKIFQIPVFSNEPDDMSLLIGQNAKIMCAATGIPPPVIKWSKDGGAAFPAALQHRLFVRPNDDHLYVVNVTREDQVRS
uniref:Ig-like domain-containing protein n=1 Tax=Angiostrongylus cantonensis TaxID=6313 RepID=A0A0K0D3L9_ANGCA